MKLEFWILKDKQGSYWLGTLSGSTDMSLRLVEKKMRETFKLKAVQVEFTEVKP